MGKPVSAYTDLTLLAPTQPDLAVFVLDITFHDPVDGRRASARPGRPGRTGGSAGQHPQYRRYADARWRGRRFLRRVLVDFAASGVSDLGPIGSTTVAAIDPGQSATASIQTSFAGEGFHLITVVVDPSGNVEELNEVNNRATQGIWTGTEEPGPFDIIQVAGEIESTAGMVPSICGFGVVPAAWPGGTLFVSGRADYIPFLPFDPDHSDGVSAVKGDRQARHV